MRFSLDEEALALRDAAAGVLAAQVSPDVIRAGWPGGSEDLVTAVWLKLAGVGTLGVLVREERGGLGLDENSLVPLFEELGRSGLPGPAAETIAVAAPLLADAGLDGTAWPACWLGRPWWPPSSATAAWCRTGVTPR